MEYLRNDLLFLFLDHYQLSVFIAVVRLKSGIFNILSF